MAYVLISILNYAVQQQQKRMLLLKQNENEDLLNTWNDLLSQYTKQDLSTARQLAYSADIPNEVRSNVWFIISGARDLMCKNCNLYERLTEKQANTKCTRQIEKDYCRSLGSKKMNMKYKDRLRRILIAYCNYNPSVPYTQGMNFIAAFTLKQYLENAPTISFIQDEADSDDAKIENEIINDYWLSCMEEEAFWTFAAIMAKISGLFCDDLVGFHKCVQCFKQLVNFHGSRELVCRLNEEDIYAMICTKWYHTLFTHPGMNENIAKRVWDVFIVEGMDFSVLLKISYLILMRHQDSIIKMDLMDMVDFCESKQCFVFGENDDHQLIYMASKLQLNEMYLKPIRNLQYDGNCKEEEIGVGTTDSKLHCRLR